MDAAGIQRPMAHEVELPQVVGCRVFEAHKGAWDRLRRQQPLPAQDGGDGAGAGGCTMPWRARAWCSLRPPQAGFSWRSASTAASTSGGVMPGECAGDGCGRRSWSPPPQHAPATCRQSCD